MEAVYDWIRGILYYMIFLSVTERLLADSHYAKHMRFFAGMVLILLVTDPVAGGLGLSSRICTLFQSISLEEDARDLKKELLGMERRRTEQIFSQYESQAAEKVEKMALDQGASCESVRITLERDPMKEDFGQIKEISLILKAEEDGQKKEQKKEQRKEQGQIEPGGQAEAVHVETGRVERVSVDLREAQAIHIQETGEEKNVWGDLRGKVADYYGLEENKVKIQWNYD